MTRKTFFLYILTQIISVLGFIGLGYLMSLKMRPTHMEGEILRGLIISLIAVIAGLFPPNLIFHKKIESWSKSFRVFLFSVLGLIIGICLAVIFNVFAFKLSHSVVLRAIIPAILFISGPIIGSYLVLKKT
jgi:hypothetical protein